MKCDAFERERNQERGRLQSHLKHLKQPNLKSMEMYVMPNSNKNPQIGRGKKCDKMHYHVPEFEGKNLHFLIRLRERGETMARYHFNSYISSNLSLFYSQFGHVLLIRT